MEGIKGGKQRRKQRLQGTTTMTDHNDDKDEEAGGSSVRRISTTTCIDKRQSRLPMDHFYRLLEEAHPNHVYPVRHKLKDCGMMRSFMTSGSLTQGAELDEGLDGSDAMPFHGGNTVIMVYGGRPPPVGRRMSNLSSRAPTCCGWRHGCSGV
jgi:hypothetical protein